MLWVNTDLGYESRRGAFLSGFRRRGRPIESERRRRASEQLAEARAAIEEGWHAICCARHLL